MAALTVLTVSFRHMNVAGFRGYTKDEISRFEMLLHNNAHLIIELARAGGFDNATAV